MLLIIYAINYIFPVGFSVSYH